MKKFFNLLVVFVAFLLFTNQNAQAQWIYTQTNSNQNVGNPGGVRTSSDATSTGGTVIMAYNQGPGGSTGSYTSTNYWSLAIPIPFTFKFYGGTVDSFCVSQNGLLTFSTSVAGTQVNSSLNSNSALPNSNLPDSTIAYFWENVATRSTGDNVYTFVFGSTGSRQLWIQNFSYAIGNMSYAYWAVVLEEGTNNIYIVDQNYYLNGTPSLTAGVQLNSSTYVDVTTGINSSAGSPNIIYGSGGSSASDNEYHIFEPKFLVSNDVAVSSFVNPSDAICNSTDSIKIEVTNEGNNNVTSFDVEWSVNGTSQNTYNHTGTLTPNSSIVINLGPYTYSGSSSNFVVYTKNPNSTSDGKPANDTLQKTFVPGMSGTYTVGTSSSDFATIDAAKTALANGLCGPVVLNLAAGTYTGQHTITNVPGQSATNTITIQTDPSATSKAIIEYDATGTTDDWTILFYNASHYILNNLHLKGLDGYYCRVVSFDQNSGDITIQNCTIEGKKPSSSSNYAALIYSPSTSTDTNIIIKDNVLLYGSASIYNYGISTTSLQKGWQITGNTCTDFDYYGIYNYSTQDITVSNNTISSNSTYSSALYGLYLAYSDGANMISENKIDVYRGYGIYHSSCDASSVAPAYFINNSIRVGNSGTDAARAIYSLSSSYQKFYHNTCVVTSTPSTTGTTYVAGYFSYSSATYSGNDVVNNIFVNTVGGYAVYLYYSGTTNYYNALDYNIYYSVGSSNVVYAGASYSNVAAYQSAKSGYDQNSFEKLPPFISSTDLHLSDACFDRVPALSAVTTDIDGASRNPSVTHPGCDEVYQGNNDIGVAEILTPSGTVSSGTQTVKVVVRNYGLNTVNGYTVSYLPSGGSVVNQNMSTTLSSCANDTVTFSSTFNHSVGCKSLTAWSSNPGGASDTKISNDSASTSFGVAMSGTYTIGGSSPDFANFTEAIDGLNCAGISGAVTLKVRSGTYTEDVFIPAIVGSSSSNTITFVSDPTNSTMPVLKNASGATIKLQNTNYVAFDGINVIQTGTSAPAFYFGGSNGNITIKNCKIEGPVVSTSTATSSTIYDETGSSLSTNVLIKDNEILYGSYGIYMYGSSTTALQDNWTITGNTIKDFYYAGLYGYYHNNSVVNNNKFIGSSTSTYGIYSSYGDGNLKITGNQITIKNYGLYISYSDATSTLPGLIANNIVVVGDNASNSARALYLYGCSYQNVYHNTFVDNSSYNSSSYPTVYIYCSSSTYVGTELKNNIIVNSGQGYLIYVSGVSYLTSDYNVFYGNSTSDMFYDGISLNSTLAGFVSSSSLDGNSVFQMPNFVSATDFHLVDPCFVKMPALSSVSTDIDGDSRGTTTTFPGADETINGSLDAGVTSILSPNGVVAAGNQVVKIAVRNYGSSTLTSVKGNFSVDGGSTTTETFTISLASCQSDTLTFSGTASISAGCSQLTAWTSDPNGSADVITINDSNSSSFGVPLAGGNYTIGSTGTYPNFTAAVDALQCAGISGPITFTVQPGTYNENINLDGTKILGTSAVNTIRFVGSGMPTITYSSSSSSDNYIVLFKDINHITFDSFNMVATGTSRGSIVVFNGTNNNITVQNSKIVGPVVSSTSSNYALIFDNSGVSNVSDSVTISNNELLNGSYGIYCYGGSSSSLQKNWMIKDNIITDFYYYGIYSFYTQDLAVLRNTISTTSSYSSLYGIYCYFSDGAQRIIGNKVTGLGDGIGMYFNACDATSTDKGLIANNFVQIGSSSNSVDGVDFYSSNNQVLSNNTIVLTSSYVSTAWAALYTSINSNYTGNEITNNIFANVGGGTAAYYGDPTLFSAINNNSYYTSGSTLISAGSSYSTLASYQSNYTTIEQNSISVNPDFNATNDYHINSLEHFEAGTTASVSDDIEQVTRRATPTIGAFELLPDVALISVASDTVCGSNQNAAPITVTFKNNSNLILSNIPLSIVVDGTTTYTETVTGTFAAGATYTQTLSTTVDLSGTTDNSITVTYTGDDVNSANSSAGIVVPYWPNPVSSFANADSCFGSAMSFSSTGTVSSGSIVSTYWMFGDATSGTGNNTNHTYASSGSYNVSISSTTNNGCKDTTARSINVLTALIAGSISGDQTICYNSMPSTFGNTTPASGSAGTYGYQWQSSADNAAWSDISGAMGATYSSGNLTTTTYFRRGVTTNVGCGPEYSASIKVTVRDELMAGTIGSDQTICYNTVPSSISESAVPTGGDGSWTLQWQLSSNGSTWSNISGATSNSYNPSALTATRYYRLRYTGGSSCGVVYSNTVTINVYNDLYAGLVGNPHSVCPNGTPNTLNQTSAATGGNGTYTYQWQESNDNATWSNISGATSASYNSTSSLTNAMFYRRNTISGAGCGTKPTNSVKVSIAPLPNVSFVATPHCFNDVMPITNNSSVSSGSITGYLWNFGDGNSSTAAVPSYTYASSGVKNIKLIATTNIGCKDSATGTVNVSNAPVPTFYAIYDCKDDSSRFKNTTSVNCGKINAFLWELGDGTTSTLEDPVHKYASSGTYTVKFKIFLPGGFKDSVTKTVTVLPKATSGFTANDVCFGDSVKFVNSSTNAYSYSWSFGDNTTSTQENPTHFYRAAQTYNVTLISADGNGCNDTTTKSVTVKVRPFAYFSVDNRCVNTATPFVNGSLYAHNYVWNFGDGNTSTSSATNVSHAYGASGNYTASLYAYNNNGCKDTFTAAVESYSNPVSSFSISDMCKGSSFTATNSSTSAISYTWNMGDGTTFSSAAPTYNYANAGTYTVSLAVYSINGCGDTSTNSVVVYDNPVANFQTTNSCLGSTTNFTNNTSGGSGTLSYSWNFGDGNTSTQANPTHTYTAAGTYTVSLTATGTGSCAGTVSKTVTIYDNPTAAITVSDVCIGTTSNFVGTSTGASNYHWNFGDGNTSTSQSPSHTYAAAGSYNVMFVAQNSNGCADTANVMHNVNAMPTAAFTANTACLGSATVFTNSSSVGSGTLTYTWSFGDGSSSSVSNPSHTYASAGNYTASLTATANGCSSTISKNVVVNDKPTTDFSVSNNCLGVVTTFTNLSGGASSYSWNFGNGSTSTSVNPTYTYASAGTYTVSLTGIGAGGCNSVVSKTVTIYSNPTADFSTANVCVGNTATFSNNSSSGSYYWDFNDGAASTATNPSHAYTNAGTYNVTLTVTNSNGCIASTGKSIVVYDAPIAMFAGISGCSGSNLTFSNTSSGATTYTWNFGDGGTSTSANPSHTYSAAGNYVVSLTAKNANGCSNTYQQTVIISGTPTANFTANNACLGSAVTFTNTSVGGSSNWNFGDGTSSGQFSPMHSYAAVGNYTVNLTVTSAQGCTSSTSKMVSVNPNPVASFTATALCTGPTATFTDNSTISSGSIASSNFEYGDGNSGTSNTHTYATAGTYGQVRLTVTSDKGCVSSTLRSVTVADAPSVSISANDVCLGNSITFGTTTNSGVKSWSFGDGNTSGALTPTHIYSSAGTYNVSVTVENKVGCTAMAATTVRVFALPVANFSTTGGCQNTDISFTNTSNGAAVSYWNFGDGGTSTLQNPTHNYANSGSKVVSLSIASTEGCTNEITKTINVLQSPMASFIVGNVCEGDVTQFTNSSRNATSASWSFGDGNTATSNNATHAYATQGTYRVILIASNGTCSDTSDRNVTINPLPNSGFTFKTAGRDVNFTPNIAGATYNWNFGDGATSTHQNPSHHYNVNNQSFNVCLKVVDNLGCASTSCNQVKISLLGVDKIENGIQIYPNPNNGKFVVNVGQKNGDISFNIYDTKGALIKSSDDINTSTFEVELGETAEGLYFIEIQNGSFVYKNTIIVTR
ncbi:MAG: PKD domain-containing protein [Bacteroidia bacterium]